MPHIMENIERYLLSCPELRAFCTCNGWIDESSLYYEIVERNDQQVIALVQFDEILTGEGGTSAGRVTCQGRLRLLLDRYGEVYRADLL